MSLNNIRVLILLTATCAGSAQAAPHRKHKHPKPSTSPIAAAPKTATTAADPEMMLVTTSSPNARSLYEEGMTYWENVKIDKALEAWRNAAKEDPRFALAHLQVSYVSTDPVEQSRERAAAKELAPGVTPAEQLLITWLSGVREDRYIEAIAAMNDLVQRFPKDKHVHLWAGSWLLRMNQYEAARKQLEVAVALDGNYAPALNDLGYTCASLGDHTCAIQFMQRYVALLPSEPNPEDSFGEILRISGHFDEALEHYSKALAIDPKFHSSLLGLADTYSLMGEQRKAREEYSHARMLTSDKLTDLSDELQSALTYIRERDTTGADQALMIVGQHAHGIGSAVVEAEALRMRALLAVIQTPADLVSPEQRKKHRRFQREKKQPQAELEYLDQAEGLLKQANSIAESDRQDEYALLLRTRAEAAGRHGMFVDANAALEKLRAMVASSRSTVVARAADGAQGAVMGYQGRWADAIPSLEQDQESVFSLFRLAVAYQSVGDLQQSQQKQAALTSFNLPTAEQSFIVPAIRARILEHSDRLSSARR